MWSMRFMEALPFKIVESLEHSHKVTGSQTVEIARRAPVCDRFAPQPRTQSKLLQPSNAVHDTTRKRIPEWPECVAGIPLGLVGSVVMDGMAGKASSSYHRIYFFAAGSS